MLWRATLLSPICMIALVLVIALGLGRFVFPIFIGLNIYTKDWTAVGMFSAAWLVAILLWRSPRFQSYLEEPPSLL